MISHGEKIAVSQWDTPAAKVWPQPCRMSLVGGISDVATLGSFVSGALALMGDSLGDRRKNPPSYTINSW